MNAIEAGEFTEFNVSEEIAHNRDLAAEGLIPADQTEAVNNWLIRVTSLCQLSGKSFAEMATWVPHPLGWKAYAPQDGGSIVASPDVITVGGDGVVFEF